MTTEEYRLRMIRAFQNANCDELTALVVMPTEKEFKHLEWLLKTHYKSQPCSDAISRKEALGVFARKADAINPYSEAWEAVRALPSVQPHRPKGKWIKLYKGDTNENCSECGYEARRKYKFCPNCGCEMEVEK